MKRLIVFCCLFVSACATRHVPDTSAWFADCYNKQRQETLLLQTEVALPADDVQGRRKIRKLFWDLQKTCQ
jgi:hypothetical protein